MADSLEKQVLGLVTVGNELLDEIRDQKNRFIAVKGEAQSYAGEAKSALTATQTAEQSAKDHSTTAASEASKAITAANRATKISGLDTVTKAVDTALEDSNSMVMTAAQRQAIVDANEGKYAASGMVHMGANQLENSNVTNINDGLHTMTARTSVLYAGRGISGITGESKTNFPVTHIAGSISSLYMGTDAGYDGFTIKLPPAPDGTVIYDKSGDARGTGKATLDLSKDIDPKYGDISGTESEAVARAFEGFCRNGDFRQLEQYWTTTGAVTIDATGAQFTADGNDARLRTGTVALFEKKDDIEIEFVSDVNGSLTLYVYGIDDDDANIAVSVKKGVNRIVSKGADRTSNFGSDRAVMFRSNNGTFSGKLSDISIRKFTEEVVTDRVDMFGLEQFDMVMKDGEIFDMVQSQATTFGDTGIRTVDSVRPDSFFAAYEGQTNISKGKCIKWSTLTDVQKRKVAKYMKERLWVNEDGDLTFTTIRQRSFAGMGNGDWANINSNQSGTAGILRPGSAGNSGRIAPQGKADTPYDVSGGSHFYAPTPLTHHNPNPTEGVFTSKSVSVAYKGRCFFYVLGTISRLNQGAYHPSYNPAGTDVFQNTDTGRLGQGSSWYTTDAEVNTSLTCFTKARKLFGAAGASVAGKYSGRPDSRKYDAIYADGLGGVVDYRLSAWDASSPAEAAKVDAKVKNGTYRGLEKLSKFELMCSLVSDGTATSSYIKSKSGTTFYSDNLDVQGLVTGNDAVVVKNASEQGSGKYCHLSRSEKNSAITSKINLPTTYLVFNETKGKSFAVAGGASYMMYVSNGSPTLYPWGKDGKLAMAEVITSEAEKTHDAWINANCDDGDVIKIYGHTYTDTSVSGEFTIADVIGDPKEILKTSGLKDGWLGSWVPTIPDGTKAYRPLTRKALAANAALQTTDNGAIWGTEGFTLDTTKNSSNDTIPTNAVRVYTYTVFAKQTKELKSKSPVLNGDAGIGRVWASVGSDVRNAGSLLTESLVGKVPTGTVGWGAVISIPMKDVLFNKNGALQGTSLARNTHEPITTIGAGEVGVKALTNQAESNGQATITYTFRELAYAGVGDLGDNGKFIMNSGTATVTDTNGAKVLDGTAILALPHGWVKNNL